MNVTSVAIALAPIKHLVAINIDLSGLFIVGAILTSLFFLGREL